MNSCPGDGVALCIECQAPLDRPLAQGISRVLPKPHIRIAVNPTVHSDIVSERKGISLEASRKAMDVGVHSTSNTLAALIHQLSLRAIW